MQMARALALGLAALAALDARAPAQDAPDRDGLARETLRIFERSCAECHGPEVRKPKGGFGHVLDLDRLTDEETYVVAGNPDGSDLFAVLIDTDPDIRMPPPDSDAPKLSPEEIEAVRQWILAGAGPPNAPPAPADAATPTPVAAPATGGGFGAAVARVFARTHPMLVHFPIALLFAALAAEITGRLRRNPASLEGAVRWCLWLAVLAAPFVVATGWRLAGAEGYKDATVFNHRWLGVATAIAAAAALVFHEWGRRRATALARLVAALVLALACLLVALAGHTGGELVYGEGYPFR